MKRSIPFAGLLALVVTARAEAANLAVITNPPTMVDVLVLVCGVACLAGTVRIVSLVRGGLLAKSWQLFMFGFGALVVAQLASVLHALEVIVLPGFVVPACLMVMAGLFLYGILETKRTLS